ncbi:hypothetical protein JGY90_10090 [Staphylococcus xylosus]|uniref:hypothetical protein n=1 Tax=Staphylococcus xylosus TaxID=1288 RepID=UPI001CDC870D|nr:hypothetical protein [Staphylococcus xylosus]UBV34054.1 hypothetical protein JGY90_10090 [Staphylococcus xylosus]
MKVVYLYDGTPYLVYKNEEGEFQYPQDEWTETAPPEGIYNPFYFNGNKWVGSTREEWLENNPEPELRSPSTNEYLLAQTQMQVTESSSQLRKSKNKLAETMLEIVEKDKRINDLEEQQAKILIEIAEMKGSN